MNNIKEVLQKGVKSRLVKASYGIATAEAVTAGVCFSLGRPADGAIAIIGSIGVALLGLCHQLAVGKADSKPLQ